MFSMNVGWWWKLLCKTITPTIVGIACALLRQTSNIHTVHYYPPPKAEGYCFCIVRTSVLPSVRHFCIQSHILEVLWRISLKLGMSIYMDKRMMHAKWHCTPSVNNGVMALCFVVCSSVWFAPIPKQKICCGGYQFYEFACFIELWQ